MRKGFFAMNEVSPVFPVHYTHLAPSIRTLPQAVQLLQEGNIIIYPTETFLAVGCGMFFEAALENIFSSKQRPQTKPLPLLAAHVEQIERIARLNQDEYALAEMFWPGSVTLLCQAKALVPDSITAGTGRVAVRISPHATARALAKAMEMPLVCSSANISGEAPPRTPQALSQVLLKAVPHVLWQGAEPAGGLPSTIVEVCAPKTLKVRRHGAISVEQLKAKGWHCVQEDGDA